MKNTTTTLAPEFQALKSITQLFADIRGDFASVGSHAEKMDTKHYACFVYAFNLQAAKHAEKALDYTSFMSAVANNRFNFTEYTAEILHFADKGVTFHLQYVWS